MQKALQLSLAAVVLVICSCGHIKRSGETDILSPVNPLDACVAFWTENKRLIDHIYTTTYAPYPIIVDTASGSRDILTLIDPQSVKSLIETIVTAELPSHQVVRQCHRYVVEQFHYQPSPHIWPTIQQTLAQRTADCKGLSLMLMSMLVAADIEVSAEISNGHMWVRATVDGAPIVLETDQSPQRQSIYTSPGFYDRPLLRITPLQTLRRVKREG